MGYIEPSAAEREAQEARHAEIAEALMQAMSSPWQRATVYAQTSPDTGPTDADREEG